MVRLFKHYVPTGVVLLALIDFMLLMVAAELAWVMRAVQIGMDVLPAAGRIGQLTAYAGALWIAMLGVGMYQPESVRSIRSAASRLLVALSLGVLCLSFVFFLIPGVRLWRSNSLYAMILSFVLIIGTRALFGALVGDRRLRRHILILGSGARAMRIADLVARPGSGLTSVGHVAMLGEQSRVPGAVSRNDIASLPDHVLRQGASEVVLALEERRGALPVDDLLTLRGLGVRVHDMPTFLERETGRLDLASTSPSYLIFADGFSAGERLTRMLKRGFDVVMASLILVATLPLILLGALAVRLDSPGPAFFRQTRVGLFGQPFAIYKLRSMRIDAEAAGAVWASRNDPRVTRIGNILRKTRIDELPQLWNVLKGDMSFVGPRPERPEFVDDLARQIPFYGERHIVKPGITGWAQLNFPYGASVEDARGKLEYDLYYVKNYSPFLDLLILIQTLRVVLWFDGAR